MTTLMITLVNDHSIHVEGDQHHTEGDWDGKSGWNCLASDRKAFGGGRSRYSRAKLQSDDDAFDDFEVKKSFNDFKETVAKGRLQK